MSRISFSQRQEDELIETVGAMHIGARTKQVDNTRLDIGPRTIPGTIRKQNEMKKLLKNNFKNALTVSQTSGVKTFSRKLNAFIATPYEEKWMVMLSFFLQNKELMKISFFEDFESYLFDKPDTNVMFCNEFDYLWEQFRQNLVDNYYAPTSTLFRQDLGDKIFVYGYFYRTLFLLHEVCMCDTKEKLMSFSSPKVDLTVIETSECVLRTKRLSERVLSFEFFDIYSYENPMDIGAGLGTIFSNKGAVEKYFNFMYDTQSHLGMAMLQGAATLLHIAAYAMSGIVTLNPYFAAGAAALGVVNITACVVHSYNRVNRPQFYLADDTSLLERGLIQEDEPKIANPLRGKDRAPREASRRRGLRMNLSKAFKVF